MNAGPTRGTDRRRWARYTVFALMALFLLLGSAFVLGETFADPGGWAAVVVAAAWVVPAAALSAVALLRPASAGRVLSIVTVSVAGLVVVESLTDLVPQDEVGPVATVAAFATSIPLAFLGLHRPGRAGLLLLVTGTALAVGALAGAPRASATVVAAPLLLFGLLFLATEPPTRRSGGVAQLPDGGGPPRLEPRHRHPER